MLTNPWSCLASGGLHGFHGPCQTLVCTCWPTSSASGHPREGVKGEVLFLGNIAPSQTVFLSPYYLVSY